MTDVSHLLNPDEVLSSSESALMFQSTFTVQEFLDMIQSRMTEEEELFIEGLDCGILTPGELWQKGKVKIRLEFSADPNTPPSPEPPSQETPSASSPENRCIPIAPNYSPSMAIGNQNNSPSLLQGQEGRLGMWS
jgi:hypothetical protein